MRRVWVLLASVGLGTLALGCHHISGVCDCEAPCHPCGCVGHPTGTTGNGVYDSVTNNGNNNNSNSNSNSNNEQLRVMPKATER